MLVPKDYPRIFFSDNGAFSDISLNLLNYSGDTSPVAVVAADDKIFFGRVKPFSAIYVEMGVVNTNASIMSVKYYDSDAADFIDVTNLVDETKGFTRSGFVQFKNPASDISGTIWDTTTVNAVVQYWIEITFSANLSATTSIKGINIVYSDDKDMNRVYDGVTNYLRTGTTSGILYHEQARKEIVQALRKDGHFKMRLGALNNDGMPAQIDEWDFHAIEEINLWSTYLAMSYLFENQSNQVDDNWARLSGKYYLKAQEMKAVYYLTLDTNDDGVIDSNERLGTQNYSGTVIRR